MKTESEQAQPRQGRATTRVVKIGGSQLRDPSDLEALARHVRREVDAGIHVVVVHGGGPEIKSMHDRLGVTSETRDGLRVTNEQTLEIATMVLCGAVNPRLVGQLVAHGVRAIGLSGIDAGLLRADLLDEPRLGRVGDRPRVATPFLRSMLTQGMVPVVAPLAIGPDGRPLNVNADTAAHAIAAALKADSLDFVSDVRGVRSRGGLVRHLTRRDALDLIRDAVVVGGMVPKLHAAIAALETGVSRVRVGDLQSVAQGTATEMVA
mgnify:CR=1 FL=1